MSKVFISKVFISKVFISIVAGFINLTLNYYFMLNFRYTECRYDECDGAIKTITTA
jgi:hypothetical protein